MKTYNLGCFGIKIELSGEGGNITSNLKEDVASEDVEIWNACVDAIESMVLDHACAGVEVCNPRYIEGIETAVLAISERV